LHPAPALQAGAMFKRPGPLKACRTRRDLATLVLAGLFLGTMGMLNILGLTRVLKASANDRPACRSWWRWGLPYPVTFCASDLISEIWGEQKAHRS